MNIWSHIIGSLGAIAAIAVGWHLLTSRDPTTLPPSHPLEYLAATFGSPVPLPSDALPSVTLTDTAMFTLLYFGTASCFAASAFYQDRKSVV